MSREERRADVDARVEDSQGRAAERAVRTDADRAAEYELTQSIDALRLKYRRQ
jgi:hypothetical protein